MNIFGGILILVFVGIIFMQLRMYFGSQKMKGNAIPDDLHEYGDVKNLGETLNTCDSQGSLLYFFSPSCGPCRAMTPVIDKLNNDGKRAIKIDINDSPQLAHRFGIRATPTILVIKNRIIEKVLLGAQSESHLSKLLDSE